MWITREVLAALDMESMRPYVRESEWFYERAGKEHYRLLAYLSTQFSGRRIYDIGSHLGDSAHALAYNPKNTVVSIDVVEGRVPEHRRLRSNIHYQVGDLWSPECFEFRNALLDAALISIDIDPHEGSRELDLVRWLRAHDYHGLVVLDDIWHFKPMRDRLWSQIESDCKVDATSLGHWSGTGIVAFERGTGGEGQLPLIEGVSDRDTSNWTLVTGYFDLTHMPDATPEIKARPPSHYLDRHAKGTLGLDQNLVIYTDPERTDQMWSLRPRHLHDRTQVIPWRFEDLPLTQYRDQIVANRGGICRADPRNTASYYLFCMARFAMLEASIRLNAFDSTHFAWVNICIERMGPQNLVHMHEALACQREKFSTAFIDYVPERVVSDNAEFYGSDCHGPTTFCSGFFTGGKDAMLETCLRMERTFIDTVRAGYGHADEQLMAKVYFEKPELFDWYIGDYQEMVTNYARVYENPGSPLRNLIPRSLHAGDHAVCRRACDQLLASYEGGACTLTDEQLSDLRRYRALAEVAV